MLTFANVSPLGPLHHAPPATTSSVLTALFPKTFKKPTTQNTTTPHPSQAQTQRPATTLSTLISHSRTSSSTSTYCQRVPPPSYLEAVHNDSGLEEDIINSYMEAENPSQEIEQRCQNWDEEIRQREVEDVLRANRRMAAELRTFGL